jgi:hypothetical protein
MALPGRDDCKICGAALPLAHRFVGVCVWCIKNETVKGKVIPTPNYGFTRGRDSGRDNSTDKSSNE